MKLFSLPDGTISRLDRAQWLTQPFDLAFDVPVVPPPQAQVGGPDWGVTAANVAIIWDSSSADSIEIKDYILSEWPWLAGAVLVPINFTGKLTGTDGFESITQANFDSTIDPALSALAPGVIYLIWCYGTPTRIKDNETNNPGSELNHTIPNVQCQAARLGASGARYDAGPVTGANGLWDGYTYVGAVRFIPSTKGDYPGTRFLSCYVGFDTVIATKAYIDKIATAHPGGDQLFVYDNRRYGQEYWLDDNRGNVDIDYTLFPLAVHYRSVLLAEFPDATINYSIDGSGVQQSWSDLKGGFTWGSHSDDVPNPMSQGDWTDGSADALSVDGTSSFWIFNNAVSWNGRRGSASLNAFNSGSFGGVAYENTPALFLAHTEEGTVYAAPYKNLYADWERGYSGIEVGWKNRTNIHFVLYGYPFVSGGRFVSTQLGRMLRGDVYLPGAQTADVYLPGAQIGEVY
jgi:hypothetical protein